MGYQRDDRDAGHQAAERRGGVALHEDHAVGRVHRSTTKGSRFGEVSVGEGEAGLERGLVHRQRLRLPAQLLLQRPPHLVQLDAEQPRQHAVVHHVAHQPPQLRVGDTPGATTLSKGTG